MKQTGRFIGLLGLVFLTACADAETKTTEKTRKVAVQVLQVQKRPRKEVLHLLGTVDAKREMKVAFKIGGKIKRLEFEEGQHIKMGALLAELDTTELLAQKDKALENKRKTKRDLQRMEKLHNQKIVPLASSQDARSLYISAGAELKIVEDHLKNSKIWAPFSGRVTKKLSEPGEIVNPGMPIAILTELDPILVRAAVSDLFFSKIQVGKTAHVKVDCYPQIRFEGIIKRIETTADLLSRTFRIEIQLPNPQENLRPGLIAQVEVLHKERDPGLFIPLDSVIGFGDSPVVFVVKDHTAERRTIQAGRIMGESVEVLGGLVEGEWVVVSGQEYLKDGQEVLIDPVESEKG